MYSTVAFGLVCGFLLGGYFITVHENSFGSGVVPRDIFPGHPKFIGAWWAGFILLGVLLILVAIPFFAFPKRLKNKKEKSLAIDDADKKSASVHREPSLKREAPQKPVAWDQTTSQSSTLVVKLRQDGEDGLLATSIEPASTKSRKNTATSVASSSKKRFSQSPDDADNLLQDKPKENSSKAHDMNSDTRDAAEVAKARAEYGRSVKEIPACMWRLLSNPVYIVTCLGSCMELSIVSGFLVFLPKYLETQFTISKSEANLFAGGIAVPGACVGIFLGGYLLKRFQLGIKGKFEMRAEHAPLDFF